MNKIYFLSILLAVTVSARSQADDSVKFSADFSQKDGLTFYGRDYGAGDDRVYPLEWVKYEGFVMSFKEYPEDWTDSAGESMMPPRSSVYFLPGGSRNPQWLVYSLNEFTVTAPEGRMLKSIEFSMLADNFKYGEVTSNVGKMDCNGGVTDVAADDRIPAKPYIWTCDNEEGYASVTITVGKNQFDGKSSQQFCFNSVDIVASGNTNSVEFEEAVPNYKVYDVDGTKRMENASVDDIKTLKNGIYIINGIKTIIRK